MNVKYMLKEIKEQNVRYYKSGLYYTTKVPHEVQTPCPSIPVVHIVLCVRVYSLTDTVCVCILGMNAAASLLVAAKNVRTKS